MVETKLVVDGDKKTVYRVMEDNRYCGLVFQNKGKEILWRTAAKKGCSCISLDRTFDTMQDAANFVASIACVTTLRWGGVDLRIFSDGHVSFRRGRQRINLHPNDVQEFIKLYQESVGGKTNV